ncbi:MAG: DUF3021 family protein [Cellulosilyticaceae bacterium]
MIDYFKKIAFSFILITTGTLVSSTLFITFLLPDATFGVEMLWQILIFPLCTSPLMLIFYAKHELSKKALLIRRILHGVLIHIILTYLAYRFSWLEPDNLLHLCIFLLLVFCVYTGVCICSFVSDQKEASVLNQKIRLYQNKDRD